MENIKEYVTVSPTIEEGWKHRLLSEFQSDYFADLKRFLLGEKNAGKLIYPPGQFIFNALNKTPLDQVKVVILGQDPYHGPGQAHGLCFSVPDGIMKPPSLKNIFKELSADLRVPVPESGNLQKWAEQGVLLLNATLTVESGLAGSHQNKGWERFTDRIIKTVSDERFGVVFMLWGRFAQAKEQLIDHSKHHILKASHPSPLSAHQGFLGCRHFSKANELLMKSGLDPVDWQL
jgi:uracil-DNA glycosylase